MKGHVRKYRGRWAGVVELGRDPVTGKRRQKWVYADTKKECQEKVNELIYQLQTGTYTESNNIRVEEYLRHWLKIHSPNLAPNTVDGYRTVIEKHVIPVIGYIQLEKLNAMHLQDLYLIEQEKYSGRTALLTHRILKKALSNAVKTKLIRENPADLVDAPKAEKYRPKVYNREQFHKLLEVAKGTVYEIPILLAGGLGMRRGEIFGLRWSDVNFKKNTITIEQQLIPGRSGLIFKKPKSDDSIRTIGVPQYIMNVLKEEKKRQERNHMFFDIEYQNNNLVCCYPDGRPINPGTFSHKFRRLLERNNLEHIRFHDLRHFNATIMLEHNIPIKVASKRLGHSTTTITQDIYQHVINEIDEQATQIINDGLFNEMRAK